MGAGSAAASSAGSVGIGDLAVSVGYRCMTTGTGPADWRTTAHVLTTVTNIGSESARGVSTLVQIPLTFVVRASSRRRSHPGAAWPTTTTPAPTR